MEGRRDDEGGGGAGGKLAKRPFRPRPSPYDRPARQEPPRRRADGWLPKLLVQPAARMLSSLFFSSRDQDPPLSESPSKNEQENCGGDPILNSENQFPESKDLGAAETSQQKVCCEGDKCVGDKQEDAYDRSGVAEIEHWLKHKMFTRDESNRLMKLLRSRTTGLPSDNVHAAGSIVEAAEVTLELKDSRTLVKEDAVDRRMISTTSEPLQSIDHDVSSSPVNIAKAYMEARKTASDYNSQSGRPKSEKMTINDDSSALTLSSSVKSPMCWPGAVVHGDHGYLTPQTQRGRIGLHNVPRTPYSGALFSRSTSKFHGVGERSDLPSAGWKRTHTPVFGGNSSKRSSVLDGGLESVNPIFHVRQKNTSMTASKGAGPSNRASPLSLLLNSAADLKGISSTFQTNVEQGSTMGSYRNFRSVDEDDEASKFAVGSSTVHPQSFKMAKKILEHLDRPVFPKEKSRELELAVARTKLPPSSATLLMDGQDKRPDASISTSDGKTACLSERDMGVQESEHANKVFSGPSTSKTQDKDQLSSLPSQTGKPGPFGSKLFQMSQTQTHSSRESCSTASTTSYGENVKSSDNGFGFTFPVPPASNVFTEPPPTPTMNSSLAASRMLPTTSEEIIPSFKFGSSEADNNRLVFSFGSITSSTGNATAAPTFKFGSDEKRDLSFKSVAEDAICY